MGFRDFFSSVFGGRNAVYSTADFKCDLTQLWYKQYALQIVAELYGSSLSKCEIKTFVKNDEKKGDNWYKFNIAPNPNQTGSEFFKQLAYKLVTELEALIVQTNDGHFYVADSFTKGDYQLKETNFTNVVVDIYQDGSVQPYQLSGVFSGENAIYMKYNNGNARFIIDSINSQYASIIQNVISSGSNKLKYLLKLDTTAMSGSAQENQSKITKLLNDDFKKFVQDNNVVMPIYNGMSLETVNQANANSQNATIASKNVNEMIENELVRIGRIFNVPKSFMLGTYEENDMDDFLTFGLDPLADMIGEAINRKYYGKNARLQGSYILIDTKQIKHFDVLTISDSINKLISSGVYTINELRTLLQEKPIDKEIGDKHWITRNYAVVGDYIQEQTNFSGNSANGGGLK